MIAHSLNQRPIVLARFQVEAIQRFALSVTPPLLYERDDEVAVLFGTATLLTLSDRYFVITASHLFDEKSIKLERIAFPLHPIQGGLQTLGNCTLARPTDERFDVAAFELHEEAVVSVLRKNWQFLRLTNIAKPMPVGRVLLCGYPASLVCPSSTRLDGSFVGVYSDPLVEAPEDLEHPARPGLDLFFHYGHQAEALDGSLVDTPKLPGVSGSSVWQFQQITEESLWSAERVVRVIGVQSSYAHSRFFRAKNWLAVALLLRQIDPILEEQLEAWLNAR
jgi:hypothetical protein